MKRLLFIVFLLSMSTINATELEQPSIIEHKTEIYGNDIGGRAIAGGVIEDYVASSIEYNKADLDNETRASPHTAKPTKPG